MRPHRLLTRKQAALRWTTAAFAGVFALSLDPVHARNWPDAGGWSIGEGDDSCGMMQEYEGKGETELLLLVKLDGDAVLSLKNSDWSAVDGQKYELDFYLNETSYGGGSVLGNGSGYKKGFLAKFGDNFVNDFAAGTSFSIYRGDVLVDKLSLRGTAAGVAMIRKCLAALRADRAAEEREKTRFQHIADDPFAVTQTEQEHAKFGAPKAIPRSNPETWISDADYPSRAQREQRSGVASYILDVSADGRVSGCEITSSSGHADLDEATCRLIPKRARFNASTPFRYEGKQAWRLPK